MICVLNILGQVYAPSFYSIWHGAAHVLELGIKCSGMHISYIFNPMLRSLL